MILYFLTLFGLFGNSVVNYSEYNFEKFDKWVVESQVTK